MHMTTSSQITWPREVLESHSRLSRGTTSTAKNEYRLGHQHRLVEEILRQHCAERYLVLCPTATTTMFGGRNIVVIKGKAMDIGVLGTDAEATILSCLVEIAFGCKCAPPSVP